MIGTTHYELLGVPPDASPDEIKSAYRRAARRYHPDTNPDNPSAADHFKVIATAYETLGDPTRRATYDAELLHPDPGAGDEGFADADDGFPDDPRFADAGFAEDGFTDDAGVADDGFATDDPTAADFTGTGGFGDEGPTAAGFAGNGHGGHRPDDGFASGWGDDDATTSAANRAHASGWGEGAPTRDGSDGWGDDGDADAWGGWTDGPTPSDPRASAWFDTGGRGWGDEGWDPTAPAHPAGFDDGWGAMPPPGAHLMGPDGTTYVVDAHGIVYPIDVVGPTGAASAAGMPPGSVPVGWARPPLSLAGRVLQVLLVLAVMWLVDGIVGASIANFADAAGDWWTADHAQRDVAHDPDATDADRREAESDAESAGGDLRSQTIRLLTVPVVGALAWPATNFLLRPRRPLYYHY